MKKRWKFLIGVTILIVVAVLWLTATHYRAKNALAAYKKQLIEQGEEFDVTKLVPPPVDSNDAGVNLMSSAVQASLSNQVPIATMMASGRARVSWQQELLPMADTPNLWSNLNAELEQKRSSITAIHGAIPISTIQFPLNYQGGYNLALPHLASVKKVETLLAVTAVFELHNGKFDESRNHLLAAARLVGNFGRNEPTQISQLVRASMGQIAIGATWEALQHDDWTPDQLAEIQKEWQSFSFLEPLENTISMERAFGADIFPLLRNSSPTTINTFGLNTPSAATSSLDDLAELGKGLVEDPAGSFKAIVDRYPKYWAWKGWWSYEEERFHLETYQSALEALRSFRKSGALTVALKEWDKKQESIHKAHPDAGNHFIAGLIGPSTVSKFISKMGDAEVARSMLVTAIALKGFHLKEGKFPTQLQELVPGYISSLPMDPMNGQPLHYLLEADGNFLFYSVGSDGVDNGGARESDVKNNAASAQFSGRKWPAWYARRDAVWPAPATDEEIKSLHGSINERRTDRELQTYGTNSSDSNAFKAFLNRYSPLPSKTN